nr:CSC1-like protein HYP1 isoform X2 [Ziziphus jujuba var. spinosa]
MLVSALLTSLAINSGLCILFFVLYSILRKQPSNYAVYVPRLLAEGKSKRRSHFNLERLIPSPTWLKNAWKLSEEELLSSSGLDAVVFMRLITFSLKVFSFAGIIGIFVLLPVNCTGELHIVDFTNLPNNSLDVFTISNIGNGSKRLWIHFSAVYVVTIFICYLLYYNDAKQLYGRLTHLKSDDTQQKYHRSCCFGLCGRKVDLTDEYEKQLVDIEKNLRLEQSEVSSSGHKEARAAFVSFKSRLGAAIAFHLPQSSNPIEWVTEEAPEPDDVYWPFFSSSFMHRWISKLTVVVACITLTILFLVPVLIVQGLTNLSQLKTWFPFLESILTIKIVSQVITGYLPSLILQLFLKAVPPIMKFLSSIQGYISHSNIEKSACNKVLWFTIWNVFFATVFSGTAIYVVDIFLEPKQIPGKLAVAVPAQASFFIAYVVTTGWTSVCSELFRIIPFSFSLIKRPFTRSTDHELEVPSLPYHKDIPRILFFALLGITYFFLAPLILPFLLLYLCLGYIIYSNQFINVYAPRYESAGKFWPIVHDSIIFSLVLMHAIAVGIFTLKKLSLASSLICPLPIFTLLFNDYCRKRFLPIFVAYSAESLIKKDRQEENDPEMSEFYNKLVIAYQDPALMPVRFSSSSDGLNSPLISSAQV